MSVGNIALLFILGARAVLAGAEAPAALLRCPQTPSAKTSTHALGLQPLLPRWKREGAHRSMPMGPFVTAMASSSRRSGSEQHRGCVDRPVAIERSA